jgi:hypothetical protein
MANKQDSNLTGLRYAEEASLKVLPGTPVWYPLEPNSYNDFGGQISTIARNPINPSRQRKKGVTTDLDASGAFNQDLTFNNTTRLLQGFFFADIREKKTTAGMNVVSTPITGVASPANTYSAASGLLGFLAGSLIQATGFTNAANNGIKTASVASTATLLTVTDTLVTEAAPPADAALRTIGHEFASGDIAVALNGNYVRLVATVFNMTTLGLIAGEWIYLGGDAAGTTFVNNKGWARINAITATYLEFDKTAWTGVVESGAGKTIRIFMGSLLQNESDPNLIKRRTYNVERTLGNDGVGVMSEYLVGAVANELTFNVQQADKITMDLSFVAVDNEQRTGTTGVKSGTRPTLVPGSAFNTSSDFSRIKLALVSATDSAPVALFAFSTELTLSVNNGVTPNKAIGVLGAFDTSAGTFEVGGSLTAYFADIPAVQAVRNNSDVTIDVVMVKKNLALVFDVPLLSLGDGRLNVEQDNPITLPLETNAAESKFATTLTFGAFYYTPDVAGGS